MVADQKCIKSSTKITVFSEQNACQNRVKNRGCSGYNPHKPLTKMQDEVSTGIGAKHYQKANKKAPGNIPETLLCVWDMANSIIQREAKHVYWLFLLANICEMPILPEG